MNVEQSGVNGEFALTPTTTVTLTQVELGYEVTVSYAITPEENYAGPPTGIKPEPPVA